MNVMNVPLRKKPMPEIVHSAWDSEHTLPKERGRTILSSLLSQMQRKRYLTCDLHQHD